MREDHVVFARDLVVEQNERFLGFGTAAKPAWVKLDDLDLFAR